MTFEASSIGKTRSAFCPAACKYLATVPVRHSFPEPVLLLSVELLGLIRSQHTKTLLSRFFPCENSLYLTPRAAVNTHFSWFLGPKKIFFHFFFGKVVLKRTTNRRFGGKDGRASQGLVPKLQARQGKLEGEKSLKTCGKYDILLTEYPAFAKALQKLV